MYSYLMLDDVFEDLKKQGEGYSLMQQGLIAIISNKNYKQYYSFMIQKTCTNKYLLTPVKFTENNKLLDILDLTTVVKSKKDLITQINMKEVNFFKR